MEQLSSNWTDFHEIWYAGIFRQTVENVEVSLNSDKNNGYFTSRQINIFIISRSFLLRMKTVSDKSCRGTKNTHFVFSNLFFFFENRAVDEIMLKNTEQPGRPNLTIWRIRIACWITTAKHTHTHTHTLTICNTYCFFTATMFASTRLIVTFIRTFPVLFYMKGTSIINI